MIDRDREMGRQRGQLWREIDEVAGQTDGQTEGHL